jgi:hypothetical protein
MKEWFITEAHTFKFNYKFKVSSWKGSRLQFLGEVFKSAAMCLYANMSEHTHNTSSLGRFAFRCPLTGRTTKAEF